MTYVDWHEKPERTTPTATVSKPPDDPKALAKQLAGKSQENEYTRGAPDGHSPSRCQAPGAAVTPQNRFNPSTAHHVFGLFIEPF